MRKLILVCLLVNCGGFAGAQGPQASPGQPDVAVLRQSWSKERIDWEKGSLALTPDATPGRRDPISIEKQINERAVKSRPSRRPRYAFLYKATFRNDGAKPIKSLHWDYVFFDAATGEELGRRRFINNKAIAPGKTRELSQLIAAPPTHRVSVYALGKRERDGLREQVIVTRVAYADGSEWRSPESN